MAVVGVAVVAAGAMIATLVESRHLRARDSFLMSNSTETPP